MCDQSRVIPFPKLVASMADLAIGTMVVMVVLAAAGWQCTTRPRVTLPLEGITRREWVVIPLEFIAPPCSCEG